MLCTQALGLGSVLLNKVWTGWDLWLLGRLSNTDCNTNHHVITEAGLVPVSQVVDVPEFLQKIVVVPAMEAAHISPLATFPNKNVFKPAGSQGGPGSVVELWQ